MMMMMMMTDDNGGDDDVDDDDDKDCLLQMSRFRGVASSLCFKARLSAKLVIGKNTFSQQRFRTWPRFQNESF